MKKMSFMGLVVIIGLLTLGVTACAPPPPPATKAEAAYLKDCKQILKNVNVLAGRNASEIKDVLQAAFLAAFDNGAASRSTSQSNLETWFPWAMDSAKIFLADKTQDNYFQSSGIWLGGDQTQLKKIVDNQFVAYIARGTEFDLSNLGDASTWWYGKEGFKSSLSELLVSEAPSKRVQNCKDIGSKDKESIGDQIFSVADGIDYIFQDQTRDAVLSSLQLQQCDLFGQAEAGKEWRDCAATDIDHSQTTNSCGGVLTIQDSQSSIGSCGELTFTIFQQDQNTGDCVGLGHWNDASGVERIGIFNYCGLVQGATYTDVVKVTSSVVYETVLGTKNQVLNFIPMN